MTQTASPALGLFVTLEGGEGSGKSTQVERAAAFLRAAGRDVVTTREPGGSPKAERLRAILLSGRAGSLGGEALEATLFAAARADHVATLIAPAIEAGRDVICDRFIDSTRVYQGLAGVDRGLLGLLESASLNGLRPELTILLDLPAADGLARAAARRSSEIPDRFEAEALAIHEERRRLFLGLAEDEPGRFRVVDAFQSVDDVARAIEVALTAVLARRESPETVGDPSSLA